MAVHLFPARADLLVESLVRASIWSSEWRTVLRRLDEMFPGGAATIRAADFAPAAPAGTGSAGAPGRLRRLETMPAGAVFRIRELAETRALVWGAVPDGRDGGGAGLVIHRDGNRIWTLAVHLPEAGAAACEASLAALLARLGPAIRDSFVACYGLAGHRGPSSMATVRQCWDRAPFGVALITTALRPVVANVIADDLLAVRGLFAPAGRSGRLRPASKACDERLERAVERIIQNPSARASVDIGQPWSRERLTIRLEALNRDRETAFLRSDQADSTDRLIATFHSPERIAGVGEVTGQGAARAPSRRSKARSWSSSQPSAAPEPESSIEAVV